VGIERCRLAGCRWLEDRTRRCTDEVDHTELELVDGELPMRHRKEETEHSSSDRTTRKQSSFNGGLGAWGQGALEGGSRRVVAA
jgi:hypothetical protein